MEKEAEKQHSTQNPETKDVKEQNQEHKRKTIYEIDVDLPDKSKNMEYPDKFEEMNINDNLLRGIYGYGFQKPSPVQQKSIPVILEKYDTIVQSQAGSGKSLCYIMSILNMINPINQNLQALFLVPIRELAYGIQHVTQNIGCYIENLKVHKCIGGTSIRDDIKAFKEGGIQIAVGTPGRILDLIKKGICDIGHLEFLVLDEADDLFQKGFQEILEELVKHLPKNVQISVFSATFPKELLEFTDKLLDKPAKIKPKRKFLPHERIKQYQVVINEEKEKLKALIDILKSIELDKFLIFVQNKEQVKYLHSQLQGQITGITLIHEEIKNMQQIYDTIKQFRYGTDKILITSEKGIKVLDTCSYSLILYYELPKGKPNFETYRKQVENIGLNKKCGAVINFVQKEDFPIIKEIENNLKQYEEIQNLPKSLHELNNMLK